MNFQAPKEYTEETAEKNHPRYGEKFLFDASGLLQKNRVRTDFRWFVGFELFVIIWAIVIIYAFSEGDLEKWSLPTDSVGRICGKERGVLQAPYLVRFDGGSCDGCLMCRPECPNTSFNYSALQLLETSEPCVQPDSTTPTELDQVRNVSQCLEAKQLVICVPELNVTLLDSFAQIEYLIQKNRCANSYSNESDVGDDGYCGPRQQRWSSSDWRFRLLNFNRHLNRNKYFILAFTSLSVLMAIASIFLMKWCALGFVCGSIFTLYSVIFHSIYEKCILNSENSMSDRLVLLLASVTLTVLIVSTAYFWKQIQTACQMLQVSCKAITQVLPCLLIPLLLSILYLLVLSLGVKGYLRMTTFETPVYRADFADDENDTCKCPSSLGYSQNSTCDPTTFEEQCDRCTLSGCFLQGKKIRETTLLQLVDFVGLYWGYWFLVGYADVILAGVFARWYWTFNKKTFSQSTIIESFWVAGTYHLGTIALGSLIILICSVVRCALNTTCKCLEKINKPFTAIILLNIKFVSDITEHFLDLVSDKAYIVCAIHGYDFGQSAKVAHCVLMRNFSRVVTVFETTNWLAVMLTILVSFISTKLASGHFSTTIEDATTASSISLIVFIISLLVTWLFMRIIVVAVNTIFQSFLEDMERNDGYYEESSSMSDQLIHILCRK